MIPTCSFPTHGHPWLCVTATRRSWWQREPPRYRTSAPPDSWLRWCSSPCLWRPVKARWRIVEDAVGTMMCVCIYICIYIHMDIYIYGHIHMYICLKMVVAVITMMIIVIVIVCMANNMLGCVYTHRMNFKSGQMSRIQRLSKGYLWFGAEFSSLWWIRDFWTWWNRRPQMRKWRPLWTAQQRWLNHGNFQWVLSSREWHHVAQVQSTVSVVSETTADVASSTTSHGRS